MTARDLWFDAHLDLAYLAVNARDMTAPLDPEMPPHPPAAVTLPSLREAGCAAVLATIFTAPDMPAAGGYPAGDAERAHRAARAQLEAYLTWRDRSLMALDLPGALRPDPHVGEIRGGMGVTELVGPTPSAQLARLARDRRMHAGLLMENADPIRSPDDLPFWKDHGLAAVSLAWARPSRYAGGNSTTLGLTPQGRELVAELDRLHITHDVSHLSDASLDELLTLTARPIIASHSNCRALLPPSTDGSPNQRHLTDDAIREIARRNGVIGVNLFATFLVRGPGDAATVERVLEHIEHICLVTGSARHVGLGSDIDGGFSASQLPEGIRSHADLRLIATALRERGWNDDDVAGFTHANWTRFFRDAAGAAPRPARAAAT